MIGVEIRNGVIEWKMCKWTVHGIRINHKVYLSASQRKYLCTYVFAVKNVRLQATTRFFDKTSIDRTGNRIICFSELASISMPAN